jgi:SAM-dependent methyltransferase
LTGIYVQYGCGTSCPDGWQNYDVSPRLRFEKLPVVGGLVGSRGWALFPEQVRYGDIVGGLPVPARSAAGVYCSHVLEHIDRASIAVALKNTLEMLQPGGLFRLVVPDLGWRARLLVQSTGDEDAADRFMRISYLGEETPLTGPMARLRAAFGNAGHRWMHDEAGMTKLLRQAGFTGIRRCSLGDAADRMFDRVEEEGRFFDTGHEELAMEARRPE